MARRAASLFALRCAALLAVVLWVVPVCAHAAEGPFAAAGASMPGMTASADPIAGPALGHLCPDPEHRPGDADCDRVDSVLASSAPSAPAPSPKAVEMTAALGALGVPPARGAPRSLVHAPGIHQLQVQRT